MAAAYLRYARRKVTSVSRSHIRLRQQGDMSSHGEQSPGLLTGNPRSSRWGAPGDDRAQPVVVLGKRGPLSDAQGSPDPGGVLP
ncbi:hypothetical protein GCM10009679_60830 [Saccharothrix algeriensis]|uniref:Uncharacterized protein n=1 Tax=Catellatospora bangladeshensis TaxID=310355 RepID=A0A8J3JV74_9ACTN|nr:hypothetical protein Cba03nite_70170 [Catellatospora bangladeshensis]